LAGAGLSAVLAVAVLLIQRPGRQPVGLDVFIDRILGTGDVELTEDVLLTVDLGAATRNGNRLRIKGVLVILSALALAVAVVALVVGSIAYKAAWEVRRADKEKASGWDRVYRDVKETRDQRRHLPDPRDHKELTKSAGSRDK
jgi:hypothetical protein